MFVKVVIGSNYGDEGKGLVTNYLTNNTDIIWDFDDIHKNNYIVLTNGGAQRGHTVENKNGFRHVFHHFGSTTNTENWYSYCPHNFIVNPAIWKKEFDELKDKKIIPQLYIHPECKVSTPFDMILNQLVERNREENCHGSVGIGIWETMQRHETLPIWYGMETDIYSLKDMVIDYFLKKVKEYNISKYLYDAFMEDINLDNFYNHFAWDFSLMKQTCKKLTEKQLFKSAANIIFENGQGLLLDQSEHHIHATPSNTGATNIINLLQTYAPFIENLEVCYVSRSYLTRHGAGPMENEVKYTTDISNNIQEDKTNVLNDYQGALRFGKLNIKTLNERIQNDYNNFNIIKAILKQKSVCITHINEFNYDLSEVKNITANKLYLSDNKYDFPIIQ